MWHWGIHSGVNRGGEPRQSILIRVQQSGDQSPRWRCCGAGEALTWAALQIRPARQRWPSETLTPRFYHLSLSFHSPPAPSHVPDCIVSSPLFDPSPIILFPFWLLSPASSPCPHSPPPFPPIFLSHTHHLSSVVSLPLPPTRFHSLNPIQGALLAS